MRFFLFPSKTDRANVNTRTLLLPFSISTRAHSAAVAPVVKTSSISTTCPCTGWVHLNLFSF